MPWWTWGLIGLALLALEVAVPGGFFVIFFGLGAVVVGALAGLELVTGTAAQWLWFSAVSVAALALLRGPLVARLQTTDGAPVDGMTGEVATPLEDVAGGGVGRAELRGTAWTARNAGEATLRRGQRCRVERVDGLTLWVRAE